MSSVHTGLKKLEVSCPMSPKLGDTAGACEPRLLDSEFGPKCLNRYPTSRNGYFNVNASQ